MSVLRAIIKDYEKLIDGIESNGYVAVRTDQTTYTILEPIKDAFGYVIRYKKMATVGMTGNTLEDAARIDEAINDLVRFESN